MFFKSKLKFSSTEGEKNLKFLRRLQKFPFNLILNQSLIQSDINEVSVKLSKMVSKRSSMRTALRNYILEFHLLIVTSLKIN